MAIQDRRYGVNIDMQGLQIKNHRLENIASDPGSPTTGMIWYNSVDNLAKVFDGSDNRNLINEDDDFYTRATLITSAEDTDQLLLADASDSFSYKRISRANLIAGLGDVSNAYYRLTLQSGVVTLDASGESALILSGDANILQTIGSTPGTNTVVIDWRTQSANRILAGPASGGAVQPTFRSLVDNDMPASYNVSNWDAAYAHVGVVSGNPHAVSLSDVGAEGALGNPGTDGFILSSTVSGTRSWVTPDKLGGQDLNALITSPAVGQDGFSVVWDDGNNEYTLVNVASSSGLTASGTPVADQVGVWASASSLLGDANLTWDGSYLAVTGDITLAATNKFYFDGGTPGDTYIYESVGNNLLIYTGGSAALQIGSSGTQTYTYNHVVPQTTTKTKDLGTAAAFWRYAYVDRLYIDDTATYIDISAGDMTFTDANSGTVTLASLVAGGSGYWSRGGTIVTLLNSGDYVRIGSTERIEFTDANSWITSATNVIAFSVGGSSSIQLNVNSVVCYKDVVPGSGILTVGNTGSFWLESYISTMYIKDVNTYITRDGSNNMTFTDAANSNITLTELVAGTNDWTKSGTSLSPLVSGDDIFLRDGTERILWRTTDSYFTAPVDDVLDLYLGGDLIFRFNGLAGQHSVYNHVLPGGTPKSWDLGETLNFWRYGYFDRLYIDNTNTHLDVTGTDMTFTSALAGTIALNDVAVVSDLLVTSFTNGSNNRILTATGAAGLNGEANLNFDGSELAVTGDIDYSGALYEPYYIVGDGGPLYYRAPIGTKYIDIDSGGSPYNTEVELDNLEYAGEDAFVFISYQFSNNGYNLYIRGSAGLAMRTVTGAPTVLKGGWLFHWNHDVSRWSSAVLTAH